MDTSVIDSYLSVDSIQTGGVAGTSLFVSEIFELKSQRRFVLKLLVNAIVLLRLQPASVACALCRNHSLKAVVERIVFRSSLP